MKEILILMLMALSILAMPSFASIGGNLTLTLEPDIVGQINQTDQIITPAEGSLWLKLRTVWLERALWTRMAIETIVQDSEDQRPVIHRLLRNYESTTETLGPYLGNETAESYGDLIREHLLIAENLARALRDKNQTAADEAGQNWRENADRLASLENSTLKVVSFNDSQAHWLRYINLTRNETDELIDKDYNASIESFDLIIEQSNFMADALAEGIIQQFPEKFHAEQN
jgi:hypothetical protein